MLHVQSFAHLSDGIVDQLEKYLLRCAGEIDAPQRSMGRKIDAQWESTARNSSFQMIQLLQRAFRLGFHRVLRSRTITARSRRHRRAMWAGAGMTKECADAIGGFRGKNVFKLAGLFFNFFLVLHSQTFGEQPF